MHKITQFDYHVAGSFVVNSSIQLPSPCYKPTIFHATDCNSLFRNFTGN